jgi:Ca2+-binding RTX toxin-like protein
VRAFAQQLAAFDRIQMSSLAERPRFLLEQTGAAVTLDVGAQVVTTGIEGVSITGSSDRETLFGTAKRDFLNGEDGSDRLVGRNGDDRLSGGEGRDNLEGGSGNDFLDGEEGNDVVIGGAGRDTLFGGRGNDTLIGGAGADQFSFVFSDGTDTITDFKLGTDRISIFGVTGLEPITFADVAGGARLDVVGTTIIVEGLTAVQMRDAGNFDFL